MSDRLWITDFKYDDRAVLVKKTGARIPLNLSLLHDVFTWFCFYFFAQSWRIWRRIEGHKRPTIAFYPDKPRPWYLIWPVMHVAGARLVDDPAKADIVMQFDDSSGTFPKQRYVRILVDSAAITTGHTQCGDGYLERRRVRLSWGR